MITQILLDMDGVVADFGRGNAALFGVDYASLPKNGDGAYRFWEMLGVSEEEFWAKQREAGASHWETLPVLPRSHALYAFCTSIAPTFFCTAYTRDADCTTGKIRWLRGFTGMADVDNLVLTRHKYLLASPTKVLIDDTMFNVDDFRKHGGRAILYPAVWNANSMFANDPVEYVKACLQVIEKGKDNAHILGY